MKSDAFEYFDAKRRALPDATERAVKGIDDISAVRTIHLTGICGKAMASLAGLLVKAGYVVTGSEEHWNPPMSTVLEHLGIGFKPFSPDNLIGVDLVIIGNAFSPGNIEAVSARERAIPTLSAADAYARFFISNRTSIVVTGTHGKTTTSSIAAHIFLESGYSANVLIGGVLKNIGESYWYGGHDAKYSIVEGDEYDTAYFDKAPKFLHYRPVIGIVTSVEFDHADIYRDMADYTNAFLFFAAEIPAEGFLLLSDVIPDELRDKLKNACSGTVLVYGSGTDTDIRIEHIQTDTERGGQVFDVVYKGAVYQNFFVPLFGIYNVYNATSVIAAALIAGIVPTSIQSTLATFAGAEQRQQVLYDEKGITVIDDFAHHPTAVVCTLEGIRSHYPSRRIIAVFEPRSATSRRKDFEIPYGNAFGDADIVMISKPPVKSVDDASRMMNVDTVVQAITAFGKTAYAFENAKQIQAQILTTITAGDVVVLMSNGHFDGLRESLVEALSRTCVSGNK